VPTLIRWILQLRGWRFEGVLPQAARFVVAGYPHTSNWDFFVFLGAISHFGIRPRFIGKHTLFRWPLGVFMRSMGGIPVRRDRPGRLVEQVVAHFERSDDLVLVMAPEGTRRRVEHWKAGFYRVAFAAGVPVVPAFIDRSRKRAGLGPAIDLSGDTGGDMARIRSFFAEHLSDPDLVSRIRFASGSEGDI